MSTEARVKSDRRIATSAAVLLGTSMGILSYGQPVLLDAIIRARSISTTQLSSAASVQCLVNALAATVVIILCRRVPARQVAAGGGIACAVAVVLLATTQDVWQLYLTMSLLGITIAGCGTLVVGTFVSKYVRNRDRVLSIAFVGSSAGGMVWTPIITWGLDAGGLVGAVVPIVLGFTLLVAANALLFLRPTDLPADHVDAPQVHDGVLLRGALGMVSFWALLIAGTVLSFAQVAGVYHALFIWQDSDIGSAAVPGTVIAAFAGIGRVAAELLLRSLSTVRLAVLTCAMQTAAFVLLAVGGTAPVLFLGSALLGIAVGNSSLVVLLLVPELFGLLDIERISGTIYLWTGIGTSSGAAVLGLLHGAADGYLLPCLLFALLSLVSGVLLWRSGVRPVRQAPGSTRAAVNDYSA
ncbi:MFS transporter [Umezawaea endophytica]|uniref:MFS transporter n=1 Tax=Umezawaea endophytica TaxID=1654476 RepID=A0A9X2VIA5_9PSEU|nr:MFS transporter [Umezawaea endophytica]MCS7477027.1 MFS transporter [Umezawaea endophytica]